MNFIRPGSRLGELLTLHTPLSRLRAGQARILAAVLAMLAVWLVAAPLVRAVAAGKTPVLVLRHAVDAGTSLTAADVTTSKFPGSLVPEGALHDPAEAVGRRLSTAAGTGEALTSARLTPSRSLAADEVALVLPVAPETAAALHPGDPVRVLLPAAAGVSTAQRSGLFVDARILTVYPASAGKTLSSASSQTVPVMMAARSQDANRFASMAASSSPTVLIRPYS